MSEKKRSGTRILWGAVALGAVGLIASAVFAGPRRFMANWILWLVFFLTIGLGSLFLVALEHLTGARWSVPLRRVPERLSSLVVAIAPFALAPLFVLPILYPWARPEAAQNRILAGKSVWLNVPFFSARVVLCLVLWALSYRVLVCTSLKQEQSKDPMLTVRMRRFAPVFMIIFAITVTLVAFDWISSLEPEWYSDVLGVYLFSGTFLAGLAATSLAIAYLKGQGRLQQVRGDHLYSLGGWIFAFTVFWSYIAFAQYLLMWYGDMPEEVFWYKERTQGPWLVAIGALALAHFFLPFFALIARDVKGKVGRLRWVAILFLCAHFLDLYWLIFPVLGRRLVFSWPELSFALFFVGAALLWTRRAMELGEDMPEGDPFLREGLEFRL